MIVRGKSLLSKRVTILILIALVLIGSFVTFYATNLILSDVSNMFYETITQDVITSLPIFLISIQFVAATFFIHRLYIRPQYTKKTFILFMDWLTLTALLGCAATVVTGPLMYGDMTAPYPFKGATVLCLIWHIAIFLLSTFLSTWAQGIIDDAEKKKADVKYVIYTIFLAVLIFFTFNRFGALLWAPIYAQARTLYLTWPFYVSLALPMMLLMYMPITSFELDKKNRWFTVWYVSAIIVLNIVFAIIVFKRGMANPLFISAISPALAIERLLTKPIDVIVQFALLFVLGLFALRYAIWRARKKHK